MVIDSSALLAILEDEAESRLFRDAIEADPTRLVSAATMLETAIVVISRKGEPGLAELRAFRDAASIETIPFGADLADIALDAFRRFRKGRHPARLNVGDCFSYALTRSTGEPLPFKGQDFTVTDLKPAA